jgi:hypothetical protein
MDRHTDQRREMLTVRNTHIRTQTEREREREKYRETDEKDRETDEKDRKAERGCKIEIYISSVILSIMGPITCKKI